MQKSISPRALDLRQIFLLRNAEREFLRRESLSRSQPPAGLPARATVPQTRRPFFRQKSKLPQIFCSHLREETAHARSHHISAGNLHALHTLSWLPRNRSKRTSSILIW